MVVQEGGIKLLEREQFSRATKHPSFILCNLSFATANYTIHIKCLDGSFNVINFFSDTQNQHSTLKKMRKCKT